MIFVDRGSVRVKPSQKRKYIIVEIIIFFKGAGVASPAKKQGAMPPVFL
ncbi:MAG: hypothetical protein HFE78_04320 [Clostridiales bacterium]|nr:hypothetical protein [Clostridiales bacterium]